jgi:hypothetical protein
VLLLQLVLLLGMRHLDAQSKTQHLDVLVEVLTVQVHHVARLVLL